MVEEAFHFLTHFEGSFFHTIKTIVKKPGQFSLDYCNGLRKKYFKPVSLFMLLVVLYLLFPRFSGLNLKLGTYASDEFNYRWISVPMISQKMKAKSVDFDTLANLYAQKSSSVSKVSLFLLIPLSAFVTFILYRRRNKYLFDHFVICTEIISFYIAFNFLAIPFISFLAEKINKKWGNFFHDDNTFLAIGILLLLLSFLFVAFKRFFKEHWFRTLLKVLVFAALFDVFVMYLYGLIVLSITMLLV